MPYQRYLYIHAQLIKHEKQLILISITQKRLRYFL